MVVRGFGSSEAEVDAVATQPDRRQPDRPRFARHRHAAALHRGLPRRRPAAQRAGAAPCSTAARCCGWTATPASARSSGTRRWRWASNAPGAWQLHRRARQRAPPGPHRRLGRTGGGCRPGVAAPRQRHLARHRRAARRHDARFGTNPFCAGVPLPGRAAGDPGLRHQHDRAGQDPRGPQQGRSGAPRAA